MRTLVTGASGFVGSHCLRLLEDVQSPTFDIRDPTQVLEAIEGAVPDCVVHLAAQSHVPTSFESPRDTFDVNFLGTYYLLDALRSLGFKGRFLYVGSGDVYGVTEDSELPLTEVQPLRPRNPYAVSKVAAEALCYQWSQSGLYEVVLSRPFNHIGAGQDSSFVVASFAKQIIAIKMGDAEPVIRVGDIQVTRDFTDVRDVVTAYQHLLERGHNGQVYNVCSGRESGVDRILQKMIEIAGVDVSVERDFTRLRPAEQRRSVGSFEKLQQDTGWSPKIDLDTTLRWILHYWEEVHL